MFHLWWRRLSGAVWKLYAVCKLRGEHTSFDRNCPKWIQEKEVQKIKAQQNISYKEAKSQVSSRRITSGVSYSAAVQSSPQGCSHQSPAIVDVLQAVIKQMEQLQKQLHIMSQESLSKCR